MNALLLELINPITLINNGIWVISKSYNIIQWSLFGTPRTPQQRLLEENNVRLARIERQIDQLYAIQSQRAHINDDVTLTSSIVVVADACK